MTRASKREQRPGRKKLKERGVVKKTTRHLSLKNRIKDRDRKEKRRRETKGQTCTNTQAHTHVEKNSGSRIHLRTHAHTHRCTRKRTPIPPPPPKPTRTTHRERSTLGREEHSSQISIVASVCMGTVSNRPFVHQARVASFASLSRGSATTF